MKTISKNVLLVAALLIGTSSFAQWGKNSIKGNGNRTTKTVSTGDYDQVKLVGSMDVHLEAGSEGNITIEADSNLLEYVIVEENGGSLKIKMQKGISYRSKKGIHITVPFESLNDISLVGSGDIDSKDTVNGSTLSVSVTGSGDLVVPVSVQNLEAKVTGSGDVGVSGKTTNLEVRVSGSGDFSGFDLASENTEVTVSGSGDARVVANASIRARVNGSGDIEYKGNPAKSDTKTSGSGDISSY